MGWSKKRDKIIFIDGKPRRIVYTNPYDPRCPVCNRDVGFVGAPGSRYPRYCGCSNPRCAVAGLKIDDEGKLLFVWLGKKLDYSLKKEELRANELLPVGMANIQRYVPEYKKILTDTLETWRDLHNQHQKRDEKSLAEQKARRKLKGWLPQEGEP